MSLNQEFNEKKNSEAYSPDFRVDKDFQTQDVQNARLTGLGLEKAMAPHSSTLTWKIPWAEEPGRLQSMGSLRVRHNPLQCSCLENPRDGRAWCAAIYGVTQIWT